MNIMEKYGYIYCTSDLKNGMKYIGMKKSKKFIPTYFGSSYRINNIKNKRPETLRVDLIEWHYSKEELSEAEGDWTNAVGLWPLSYNLKRGGIGGWSKHSKERTQNQINSRKKNCIENNTPWHTEETINKIKESNTGQKRDDKTKENCRNAQLKVFQNPDERKRCATFGMLGKKHKEETIIKMRKPKPLESIENYKIAANKRDPSCYIKTWETRRKNGTDKWKKAA